MKTKNLTFLLIASVFMTIQAFSQMNYWTTPPYKYSMSGTPFGSALYSGAPSSGTFKVANGAYDPIGNLLFYVQDERVYKKNGTSIGDLFTSYYGHIGGEVVIVPIPGECKKYYVIYSIDNPIGNAIGAYVKVDCSGTNPVVIYNAGSPFNLGGISASDIMTLACGKMNGSGATATYYLYAAGYDPVSGNSIINHYVISSSGISAGTSIGSLPLSSYDTEATELELSHGGDYLAWSRPSSNKVFVLKLTGSNFQTYVSSSLQTYSLTAVKGLEFDNSISNPVLYVAGGTSVSNVFKKIDIASTSPIQTSISSTLDWSSTFLEYAKNGKIYGMVPGSSNTHKLAELDLGSGVITSQTVNFDSRHTYLGVYTLPDQLDGQDYSNLNIEAYATINQITVNGNTMQFCNESGIPNSYYNCLPISLNATYNNSNPTQYKIDILYVDSDCDAYYINNYPYSDYVLYYGAWTAGSVPANLDLRTLTDAAGKNLGNTTGVYKVFVYVKNACGTITSTYGIFNVLQGVSPAINLQVYDYTNPQTYLSTSQNISSPRNVGSSSLGFRVSGSSGNITEMKVKVEEYTSSGSPVSTVFEQTKTVNNISTFTYENLNNYCVPSSVWGINPGFGSCSVSNPLSYIGYSGYFSYTNAMFSSGKYYKLTVTLSNPCSSSSNWTYLYVDAINQRPSQDVSITEQLEEDFVVLYPNPANTEVNIKLISASDNTYTITVFDAAGKLIKTFCTNELISKGEHMIQVSTTDMSEGIYTFKITSGKITKTSLINVVK
ncbi:T9SS type A sorting domain-containing protein [Fluviicola taffensis]|uniref:T9SS type A sorting domain-containing protein n=1 Tax=Fluviicola taffensis TaxID=191579 RepID=UPI003138499A